MLRLIVVGWAVRNHKQYDLPNNEGTRCSLCY